MFPNMELILSQLYQTDDSDSLKPQIIQEWNQQTLEILSQISLLFEVNQGLFDEVSETVAFTLPIYSMDS